MKSCSFLVGCSHSKNASLIKQVSKESDAGGRTLILKAIGHHHHRVTGQVGGQKLITSF